MVGVGNSRYKFFWKGNREGLGGVGLMVAEKRVEDVVEVKRWSDRVMHVKMVVGKEVVCVVSAYAPQVGRAEEEKEAFWSGLDVAVGGGSRRGSVGNGGRHEWTRGSCG